MTDMGTVQWHESTILHLKANKHLAKTFGLPDASTVISGWPRDLFEKPASLNIYAVGQATGDSSPEAPRRHRSVPAGVGFDTEVCTAILGWGAHYNSATTLFACRCERLLPCTCRACHLMYDIYALLHVAVSSTCRILQAMGSNRTSSALQFFHAAVPIVSSSGCPWAQSAPAISCLGPLCQRRALVWFLHPTHGLVQW
jgi:hypothetical protein